LPLHPVRDTAAARASTLAMDALSTAILQLNNGSGTLRAQQSKGQTAGC
jgi:hypothetical protein